MSAGSRQVLRGLRVNPRIPRHLRQSSRQACHAKPQIPPHRGYQASRQYETNGICWKEHVGALARVELGARELHSKGFRHCVQTPTSSRPRTACDSIRASLNPCPFALRPRPFALRPRPFSVYVDQTVHERRSVLACAVVELLVLHGPAVPYPVQRDVLQVHQSSQVELQLRVAPAARPVADAV